MVVYRNHNYQFHHDYLNSTSSYQIVVDITYSICDVHIFPCLVEL